MELLLGLMLKKKHQIVPCLQACRLSHPLECERWFTGLTNVRKDTTWAFLYMVIRSLTSWKNFFVWCGLILEYIFASGAVKEHFLSESSQAHIKKHQCLLCECTIVIVVLLFVFCWGYHVLLRIIEFRVFVDGCLALLFSHIVKTWIFNDFVPVECMCMYAVVSS